MDPQFLSGLQDLLQRLVFASDTQSIQTVTSSLNQQFYTNAACIPALLTIAKDNEQWQVRQLAAVELRKRVPKFWGEIDDGTKQQIREMILKMIVEEKDNLTRHGLARVISSVAKIDIPNQQWGSLIQFLYECCQSPTAAHREIGVYVLDSLFETIADTMAEHMQHLFSLFSRLINDPESLMVQVTTLEALGKVAEFIEPEDRSAISTFQGLVPAMAQVLQKCLANNEEDSASRCFEVFNTLLLLETPLLNRHFGELIEFSINVGGNEDLDDNLRIMALNFLVWTATYKRGRLQKLKIVQPLIEKMLPITTQEDPEDVDDDSPSRVALRVLNVLSTNLPPQQVFPAVISLVLQYMQNADPMFRKGAMLSLAITIEGCVDFIRPKTGDIVALVGAGLSDPDARVRRASCMALGCIADQLDDEIAEYHEKLLPLIFGLLNDSNKEIVKYACSALEAILEGLGDSILNYLPQLMERLIVLLDTGAMEVKPIALAAIGSAAHSSGDSFAPYFNEVVARIKQAMALTGDDDALALRGVATDTAGAIAEAVGKDAFRPHLEETMTFALQGMEIESSNMRDCGFCYFGVMSRVFKEEFSQYLSFIAPHLLQTFRMDESAAFGLDDDSNANGDVDDDEEEDAGFNVSTAIADEKEIAADAAGELFASTTTGFLPYVQDTAKELIELLEHYSDTTRKSALVALFTYIRTFNKMANPEQWKAGVPLRVPVDENTDSMIKLVLPALVKMWEDEDDKLVVTQICTELRSIMQDVGPAVTIDYAEEIAKYILEIFEKKALCQTVDIDDEEEALEDDDDLAEHDSLLIGAAADCVAEFADVFGEGFEPIMDTFLPHIAGYAKASFGVSERAMAVGCLAEITKNMGPAITKYAETLFPIFMAGLQDPEPEVRSNAAYGVGVLIEAATIDASPYFNDVLKAVYPLIQLAGNQNNANDNAAGCVARLILENADAVPLGDVLPSWIAALPIKTDHLEDIPVYDAVCHLLKNKRAEVEPFLAALTPVLKQAMEDPNTLFTEESRQYLASL
ncbi:ARM repeat-containing protein [Martensiomyces pterosporus]|nr:ARM repeat-containing protein [Martensiomyces pterosporus]